MVEMGDAAPQFCLPGMDGQEACLDDFQGKWLVLYFYPKDNTPGCTRQVCAFAVAYVEFEKLNANACI